MKKIYILAAFLLAFAAFSTVKAAEVSAHSEVTVSTGIRADIKAMASTTKADFAAKRMELKNEIEARKQDMHDKKVEVKAYASTTKADMEAKRIEVKAKIQADLKTRLAELSKNSNKRLSDTLSRLNEIKAKIETRLTKIESEGGNTTEARAKLVIANTKLASAKVSIDAAAAVNIPNPAKKESVETLKVAIRAAESAILEAKTALFNTVTSMISIKAKANVRNN